MGSESQCTVHFDGKRSEGKALLETDHLIFRGTIRLNIPRKAITKAEADAGTLRVTFPDGTAAFELGPSAAKWAEKIRNPPSLLDKLGVKPDMRVAVLGVDDDAFLEQLAERTSDIARRTPKKDTDVIVFGANSVTDLSLLEKLRGYLTPAGAIWVVHTKGKGAAFKDVDVFAAAKQAGLVDVKVAAFSPTHTAEKLVVPVKLRK
jgi:NADPH-dependent 2,4-dienoyl-CoA reductase/sulfur reductase-like enzyme